MGPALPGLDSRSKSTVDFTDASVGDESRMMGRSKSTVDFLTDASVGDESRMMGSSKSTVDFTDASVGDESRMIRESQSMPGLWNEDEFSILTTNSTKTQLRTGFRTSHYGPAVSELMPHLTPIDRIRKRGAERSEKRARVQKEHRRRLRVREEHGRKLIAEHARRVENRKHRAARRERARSLIVALAHAGLIKGRMGRQLASVHADAAKRKALADARKQRYDGAVSIQKAVSNWYAYRQRHEVRDLWERSLRFSMKLTANRWRAKLHIRCWRRRMATRIIRGFLRQSLQNRGSQAVAHFMSKVKRIQTLSTAFLDARRERKKLLRVIWDEVEARCRAYLDAKAIAEWKPLEPLPVKPRRRGSKVDFFTRLPELVNSDINRLKKVEQKMDALAERQRAAGVAVQGAAGMSVVRKIPAHVRDAAVDQLMMDIVARNDRIFESKTSVHVADIGTDVCRQQQLEARRFTRDDARHILTLHTYKGQVRKLDSVVSSVSLGSKAPKTLLFFTAFAPDNLLKVIAKRWLKCHKLRLSAADAQALDEARVLHRVDLTNVWVPECGKNSNKRRHRRVDYLSRGVGASGLPPLTKSSPHHGLPRRRHPPGLPRLTAVA